MPEEVPILLEQRLTPKQAVLCAIYVLLEDGLVRYVGQTKDPKKRLASHLGSKSDGTHRGKWLVKLAKAGKKPEMRVIEWTDNWDEAERRWIAYYRSMGADLVNSNDGGFDSSQLWTDKASARRTDVERLTVETRLTKWAYGALFRVKPLHQWVSETKPSKLQIGYYLMFVIEVVSILSKNDFSDLKADVRSLCAIPSC